MDTGIAPRRFTRPLIVALSAPLVVALFQPIRGRAQDAVDWRLYRARYDAARTTDAGRPTVEPAHAAVSLRGRL